MNPWVRITMTKAVWPYAWIRFVPENGFRPDQCCARALKGAFWPNIPWVEHADGDVFEGPLNFKTPFAYLCLVHRSRDLAKNIHAPMRPNKRSKWVIETDEVKIEARGLQRVLPIPPIPEDLLPQFTAAQQRCRCVQWSVATFPQCLAPSVEARPKAQRGLFDDVIE